MLKVDIFKNFFVGITQNKSSRKTASRSKSKITSKSKNKRNDSCENLEEDQNGISIRNEENDDVPELEDLDPLIVSSQQNTARGLFRMSSLGDTSELFEMNMEALNKKEETLQNDETQLFSEIENDINESQSEVNMCIKNN